MDEEVTITFDSSNRCSINQPQSSRDTSTAKVHVNPKMIPSIDRLNSHPSICTNANTANVYINPNFLNNTTTSASIVQPSNIASNTL